MDEGRNRGDQTPARRARARRAAALATLVGWLGSAVWLPAADAPTALIGRWRSLETSRGGIGSMITFREGGALEFSPGAVVEMPYRIESGQLVLPGGKEGAAENRQKIVWLGDDKLRLDQENGAGIELTRAGNRESASEPILGEWHGRRDMGGQEVSILFFFRREGRSLLLIPFLTQTGKYTVDKAHIHLEWPDCPIPEAEFAVDADALTFTADGKTTRYSRY
jgi:hypothetical protein